MTATIPKGFHPEPFSYHQELELDIDALSNAGDGIGRVDGWVVFVPFALPGDRVKARVWRNDKNYSSADLVEIINPSQDRVEPGCRLFGTCGGCQYQHLSYDRQLLWKTRQVADLLRLQAGLELPVSGLDDEGSVAPDRASARQRVRRPATQGLTCVRGVVAGAVQQRRRQPQLVSGRKHFPDHQIGVAADGNGAFLRIESVQFGRVG